MDRKKYKSLSESCQSITDELLNYEVIRQIGKGSFSNVFLCKNDMPLHISESENHEELFIIKEINLNELAKKYIIKSKPKEHFKSENEETKAKVKQTQTSFGGKVTITPYNEMRMNDEINDIRSREYEYYFNRLKQLIESEIEILCSVDHKNIIKFYGYTYIKGIFYLRMEYCNGGDVYEYLKKNDDMNRNSFNGITNEFLYEFIKQTTDALVYLHEKNIIHRDIKLHNVLMKGKNNPIFKISDFGFACYDLTSISDFDKDDILVKKYYKLCGTPYYMAPEIILNMNKLENGPKDKDIILNKDFFYNKKIDVWSYGICIYEMMFNILPFSNIKNVEDLEKFYRSVFVQDIIERRVKKKNCLNEDFKTLLLNMLKIDYKQRYSIKDVDNFVKTFTFNNLTLDKTKELQDLINCKEHNYKQNEKMKEHIVKNPVNNNIKNNERLKEPGESWEKINKSSSLIMKMSVQNGFLKWLLK